MENKKSNINYEQLRNNINLLTNSLGLFPAEVAEALGMNKRTYSLRRKCPWTFSLEELDQVATILNIDLPTLLYGSVYIAARKNNGGKSMICY